MSRRRRALTAAAVGVALVTACGASPSARLSKDLIPVPALQSATWGLRIASSGRTLNPFGVQSSSPAPHGTSIARAEAVAVRQWVQGSGSLTPGPLPEGVITVIDTAAHFRTAADAHTLVADLSSTYGAGSSPRVAGSSGATLLTAAFSSDVPGGQVTGHEALVVIERGAYVFTVLVVGGGSRPNASDTQALATLQAAAIPASLS